MTANINSVNGQSMYDICLMAYKTLDYLIKLCTDNGIYDVNYIPPVPQIFSYDTTLVADQKVANFVYATAITTISGQIVIYLTTEDGSEFLTTEDGTKFLTTE